MLTHFATLRYTTVRYGAWTWYCLLFAMGEEVNIFLLGDSCVGKSAAAVQYVQNIFIEKYDSTTLDTYRKLAEIEGVTVLFHVFDLGSQCDPAMLGLSPYTDGKRSKEAPCVMIIFDITSRTSFDHAAGYFLEFAPYFPPNVPVILVGNKTDLKNQRVVQERKQKN